MLQETTRTLNMVTVCAGCGDSRYNDPTSLNLQAKKGLAIVRLEV